MERVVQADVVAAGPLGVGGVDADIGHEQVEQAVAVVVEEHCTRGVPDVPDARLRGDVAELPAAEVFEQPVAVAHRGDEEVGVAVVIDVRERAPDRDRVRHTEARLVGDVREPAAAQVLPQLVAAELGDEVEVGEPVAIDVGRTQSRPVVVVDLLVELSGVVDDPVLESDAARLPPIREPEVVKRLRLCGQLGFLPGALEQPRRRRYRGGRGTVGPARGGKE